MRDGETEDGVMGEEQFDFENWRVGRVYWTSDLHLGHERIIPLCGRPFGSVGEMNEELLARINATVGNRNTLVIAGDVLLGKMEVSLSLLSRIKAKRIWILPGNHDRFSLAYRHGGSPEVRMSKRRMWLRQYEEQVTPGSGGGGGPGPRELRCSEDRAPSAWQVLVGGRQVMVSHYPYRGDSQTARGGDGSGRGDRYRELRPVWGGLPLIHGHVHGRWRVRGPMFNVGVDVNDFRPVGEDVLGEWLMDVPVGGARLAAVQDAAGRVR